MAKTSCLMKYTPSIFNYVAHAGPDSVSQLKFYYATNTLMGKENCQIWKITMAE